MFRALVAQWIERSPAKAEVVGSNPAKRAIFFELAQPYRCDIASGPIEVPLQIVEYYEDGFAFNGWDAELTAEAGYIGGTEWFSVGASPSNRWAPGRYWVYVYADGQKVAEVQYEVTP